ncbi:MAG: EAL domain-containing protein [Eubacteriales bacterium]
MTRRYVARQIIVDRQGKPYAYELLYRNSVDNCYPSGTNQDIATKDLISTLNIDFNLQELTLGCQAFINFPREVILSDAITFVDKDSYVIEVLEDVNIDEELTQRIFQLEKMGYQFAIDDYTGEQDFSSIEEVVSLIKVDIQETSVDQQKIILAEFKDKKKVLAEKIENEEEFQQALALGYDLFQGYHFARPTLIIRDSVGFSQSAVMMLLKEVRQDEVDFDKIDSIIKADAGLTFRLLARGNTAQFAGKSVFTTPAQVVVRMGIEELQKWATLMLMQETAEEGQEQKLEQALLRGLFMESLAVKMEPELDRQERYFVYLKGLFSIFPSETRDEIFAAMNFQNKEDLEDLAGDLLYFVYSYEMGDYDTVDIYMEEKELTDAVVLGCYKSSIASVNQTFAKA